MAISQKIRWDAAIPELNNAFANAPYQGVARPIVSYSSGRYETAEDMVGFWSAALGLALAGFVLAQVWTSRRWTGAPATVWAWGPLPVLMVIVMGFAAGTLLCTQMDALRRLFVTRTRMTAAVAQRAGQLYHDICPHNDGDGAANPAPMLIYVSVFERMVEIIPARAGSAALQAQLADIRTSIVRALKSPGPCEKLQQAILNACRTLNASRPSVPGAQPPAAGAAVQTSAAACSLAPGQ